MGITAGLDVGGAHLKVAVAADRRIVHVEQIACPLWLGMTHLDQALALARPLLHNAETIAITMTGELSDLFASRREGVETLVKKLDATYEDAARFWMGQRGFGSAAEAIAHVADTASTNFLATATLVGRRLNEALLIDMGSTTTDIIAITNGEPRPIGLSDATRLATGELVYTGLTRTAVMGVTAAAHFRETPQGLCREYLATLADVRRILGQLPDGVDQHATADGRSKSLGDSVARLARMFGRDAADGTQSDWRAAAAEIAEAQMRSIADGYDTVAIRTELPASAPVVVAGIGAGVIAASLVARSGRDTVYFGELAHAVDSMVAAATHAAPAVAVALLLQGPDVTDRS
jgi:probable H4MPT-linked C1 transfer pathway protein